MRKYGKVKRAAALLASVLVLDSLGGAAVPPMVSYGYTEKAATVNATSLNVRSGPGTTYSLVGKLGTGAAVTVTDEKTAADGALWYQIQFTGSNGAPVTGYVLKSYIKFPTAYTGDGDFEARLAAEGFPESYKTRLRELHAQYPSWVFKAQNTNLDWNTAVKAESQVGRTLVYKSSASSWKSIENGAFDWDTSSWTGFDGSVWVAASEDIVRYYMDPRNFLDPVNAFQFLTQTYDSNSHTVDGLRTMVKGTFLEGKAPGSGGSSPDSGNDNSGQNAGSPGENSGGSGASTQGPGGTASQEGGQETTSGAAGAAPSGGENSGVSLEAPHASITPNISQILMEVGPGVGLAGPGGSSNSPSASTGVTAGTVPYVDIIMNAGTQSGVNPYVLAAMIIQEQGSSGKGGSISGTESGYGGIYNFFNIEAYQSGGMGAVTRGLWWASQSGSYGRPWNSVEKSILGGAQYYGNNYVKVGQDTFYLKKFNVQGSNLYKHQYMTNVQAAASEGAVYAKAYNDEMKRTALEFKIPVFKNMPENPAGKPVGDGSPNNKLSGVTVDGFVMTPTFNRDTTDYNLIVDPSVSSVNILASALDSTAQIAGTGAVQLQNGANSVNITVTAQNGSVRNYVIHVVRQDNGPTYSSSLGGSVTDGSGPGGNGQSNGPGGDGPGGSSVIVAPDGSTDGTGTSPNQSSQGAVLAAPGA